MCSVLFFTLLSSTYSFVLRDLHFNGTTTEQKFVLDNYWKINTRLYKHLFKDYVRQLPAIFLSDRNWLPDRTLQTNITMKYARMLDIDQARQSITLIMDFYMQWKDPRLTWNISEFNGIQSIALAKKETVYLPDALPFDVISYEDILPEEQQYVNLDSDGSLAWYKTAIFEIICRMNLKDFPFDTQQCDVQLTSYNFYLPELEINGILDPAVVQEIPNTGNGEWTVLNISVTNSQLFDNFGVPYAYVFYTFTMRRATTYYVVLMIVPSFILTILCVLGLFWKQVTSECYMDSLNLGFAAILAMMFVLQMVTSDMPKINETDRLSVFLMCNLSIITAASLIVMIMGKSHKVHEKKRERNAGCGTRFDYWMTIFYKRLNIILMVVFCTAAVINMAILRFS